MRTICGFAFVAFTLCGLAACDRQYKQDAIAQIRATIENTESPTTLKEWHRHQEQLEMSLDSNWEFALKDPDICQKLSGWPDQALLVLHAKIYETRTVELLCRDHLLARIEAIRARGTKQFFKGMSLADSRLTACKEPKAFASSTSLVKVIDTKGGPRFVGGRLKRCQIAFTFDDGPHRIYTHELLTVLDQYKVKAVFFEMGGRVHNNPQLTQKVAAAGHTVANHTWSHPDMTKMDVVDGVFEIQKGFDTLLKTNVLVAPFFRFPYGAFTTELRDYLMTGNLSEFFWNMDTLDWKITDPEKLFSHVLSEIEREKQGIILFHDVHPQTIDIMPHLLKELAAANYETVQFVPKEYLNSPL